MSRRTPTSTRTTTLFPPTTHYRSHTARGQPFFRDDPVKHLLRIGIEAARAFTHHRIFEDGGELAMQFPGAEERRPVEIFAQRSEEHTSEIQSLMRISYAVFCLQNTTLCNNVSTTTSHYQNYI